MDKWRRLTALLLGLVLCLCTIPAGAAEREREVVRVAYPIQAGLTDRDENGAYCGYTYDYLQEIAQYTGWEYEFVEVEGDLNQRLTTLMDMLMAGEIDLMGDMLYSESLAELMDYTSQGYGQAYTVLRALNENTSVTTDDYQTLQGMRVATIEGAKSRQAELEDFCTRSDISYELVLCKDEYEMMARLRSGEADVMLGVDMNGLEGTRTVARFAPRAFYFVTTKGNNELINQVSAAIRNIESADPYFPTTLYEQYFGQDKKALFLSDGDRALVESLGTLRVGVAKDRPPFEYADPETGELKGICLEVLDYVAKATGLQFELVPAETQVELQEWLRDGKLDLTADINFDYELARKYDVSLTRAYLSSPYVILLGEGVSESGLAGKRLAMANYFNYDGEFVGQVVRFPDTEHCIEAVNSGEADYTYVNTYTFQYYLNRNTYKNIRLIPQTYEPHEVAMGVSRDGDPRLLPLLNRVLGSIPEGELQAMIYHNTLYQKEYTLLEMIQEDPAPVIEAGLVLALAVILVLVRLLQVRGKRNKQAALELRKHYQIYELSNEHFFEFDRKKSILTISERKEDGQSGVQVYEAGDTLGSETEAGKVWSDAFLAMLREWEDGTQDLRCPQKDGSYRWMRITARCVRDDDGTVAYVVGKLADVDEEVRARDALMDQAQKDGLTQIYNAAVSRERIESGLSDLEDGSRGALFILDVDHFKEINDIAGHYTGDQVLRELAGILRLIFRSDDVVGRLGGDEFVVYMTSAPDRDTVERRCRELRDRIHKIGVAGLPHGLTVSVGVAFAEAGTVYDALYQAADGALYRAKDQGRDRFVIAE